MAGPDPLLVSDAFRADQQEQFEASLLDGYSSETGLDVDRTALTWFSALVIVDKWAAVTRNPAGARDRLRYDLMARRLHGETARAAVQFTARGF